MTVLVVVEGTDKGLSEASRRAVGAAGTLGPALLLTAGVDCRAAAEQGAVLSGVAEVLLADHPCLPGAPENLAPLLANLAPACSHVLAPADAFGATLIPFLGALLGVGPVTETTAFLGDGVFERPCHAARLVARVRVLGRLALLTVRPSAFSPAPPRRDGPPAPIRPLPGIRDHGLCRRLRPAQPLGERPDLESARIAVVGGRGLEEAGSFALMEALAHRLNAAVGASRGAVDAELASADLQVGQTGRIIAPDLYLGVGVSGSLQHVAGIKEARVIAAINKDPAAPLLAMADVAWVADLRQAVPELLRALQNAADASP
ncbi:MAG: electron transfer flavoprotein subunit alpha/FixB family protein [Magnetococcales bacterium]|nr:electron transfer flavoprotein subunit alpha/FixB family protein [Magnetococcales bacterium]